MKSILIIGGPTGCGKNRLALLIADRIPSEIVNADSRQIYRDLPIGTNQPSADELKRVPHRLYGFLSPDLTFSAAEYEKTAVPIVQEIQNSGRLPILVGGTGFYIKAFLKGSWPTPPRDPRFRKRIEEIERRHPSGFLHRMLLRIDPKSAASIAPKDAYRLRRALEIYFQTGRRRSEFRRLLPDRFSACKVYLDRAQEDLKPVLIQRVDEMLKRGWVEEVRRLRNQYSGFDDMPAAASLGYPEIIRFLRNEIDHESMKMQIAIKTWQYAKRQRTWFRNQDAFLRMDSQQELHKIEESVLQCLRDSSDH